MYIKKEKVAHFVFPKKSHRKASRSKVRTQEMVQFVKQEWIFNVTSGFQVKNQSTAWRVSNSSMQTGRSPNFTGWTSLIKFLSPSPVRVSISLIHTQTNQDICKTTMIIVLLHPHTAVLIQGQTYPLHSQTPRENNRIRFVFYFCFYMTVQKNSLYWLPFYVKLFFVTFWLWFGKL